jgi:hypothetical protein
MAQISINILLTKAGYLKEKTIIGVLFHNNVGLICVHTITFVKIQNIEKNLFSWIRITNSLELSIEKRVGAQKNIQR